MSDNESFDSKLMSSDCPLTSPANHLLSKLNKRMGDSSNEDDVEKEVAFLANNFWKFLKMKNNGKSFSRENFSSFKNDKREFNKEDGKDSSSTQGIECYECNGHGHLKKECPN